MGKKKLRSLDLKTREGLIDPSGSLSVREQCTIVSVNRSTFYYEKQAEFSEEDLQILKRMDEIYTQDASYGYRRQRKQLKMEGYVIGEDRVRKYMATLGLKALYPKAKKRPTKSDKPQE